MKLNTYAIIAERIEHGVTMGWNHAHKHDEKPDQHFICDHIVTEVLNSLSEVIIWDEPVEQTGDKLKSSVNTRF